MYNVPQGYGLSSDAVLGSVMGTEKKSSFINAEVRSKLEDVSNLIDKEQYKEAKERLISIEKDLNGSIPDTLGLWSVINTFDFEGEDFDSN